MGIAPGPLADGVAFSNSGAPVPVVTGLVIAVIGIAVAWATSFLKPPAAAQAAQPEAAAKTAPAPEHV